MLTHFTFDTQSMAWITWDFTHECRSLHGEHKKNHPDQFNGVTYRDEIACLRKPIPMLFINAPPPWSHFLNILQTSVYGRKHFDEQNAPLAHFTKTHHLYFTSIQRSETHNPSLTLSNVTPLVSQGLKLKDDPFVFCFDAEMAPYETFVPHILKQR